MVLLCERTSVNSRAPQSAVIQRYRHQGDITQLIGIEVHPRLLGGNLATSKDEIPNDGHRIELDYFPEKGALAGSTHADNVKHVIARQALIEILIKDERVVDLWWKWGGYTGLNEAAHNLAFAIDQVAVAAGFEDPGSVSVLYETGSDDDVGAFQNSLPLELVEGASAADQIFNECIKQLSRHAKRRLQEAVEFVHGTLKLPWNWLALESIQCFQFALIGFATGQILRHDAWAEEIDPLAPEIDVEFHGVPGETVSQALDRLSESFLKGFNELRQPYKDQSIPRGRVPTDDEAEFNEGVGKYARWFYRNCLCGESIRKIGATDGYDRSTVRYGIDEAERLLGLTVY